jgi:GMP synthase-like glutamine amidotransferase
MRVLVVQNFDNTGLGQVGAALEEAAARIDIRRPYLGDRLPERANGHDALVVLGGAQSALDDEDHPYMPPLLALMRDFADSGRSVLGICLGSQLLARAYGAQNLLGVAREFGWRSIARTPEASGDPVLGAVPEEFPSFQWHDDTFTLPPGAVRLASNEAADNQAFRIGRAAYGIQFHFEADRNLVARWNDVFADFIAEHHPDWRERHEAAAASHGLMSDEVGLALARAWVATIPAGAAAEAASV